MIESNLEIWNRLKQPPKDALKTIKGGRLAGMTDINPQWRYQAMTEMYGPCGQGWDYRIDRLWMETSPTEDIAAFAQVTLRIFPKHETPLGEPQMIPGIGGSMFVASEKAGLRTNDECYKMAVTDALSVAMKMLGVGADIYMGRYDGSKYAEEKILKSPITPNDGAWEAMTETQQETLVDLSVLVNRWIKKNNPDKAVDEITTALLDNEEMLALWTLFDAPTRRQLKEAHAQRSKRNAETQPTED